ncbi:hypothetical protein [Kitasatospora aureofaciens]|uniref:hypothetical protein n=1 Tax=Kitasatospora aureofaciens TaxID=1894 RepID=UPI0036F48FFE
MAVEALDVQVRAQWFVVGTQGPHDLPQDLVLTGVEAAGWLLFPSWAAVLVTLLAPACCGTELPRWRRLLGK